MALVYDRLREIAAAQLRNQRPDHTLQATALVHEAYIRLAGAEELDWKDRTHFFASAARVMRNILIDYARTRGRVKRGGGRARVSLEEIAEAGSPGDVDIGELGEALEHLARVSRRQSDVVTLRFLGGLTVDEVAATLGVSKRTAEDDWRIARAWLRSRLMEP